MKIFGCGTTPTWLDIGRCVDLKIVDINQKQIHFSALPSSVAMDSGDNSFCLYCCLNFNTF